MKKASVIIASLLSISIGIAHADEINAEKLAAKYTSSAQLVNKDFKPSAIEGKLFFNRIFKTDGHEAACASCHTKNPADIGENIVTKKPIKPLSPVINNKRFTDIAQVEDNFADHCNEILGTDCSAQEKANFITYLLTEKTPSQ